MSTRSTLPVNRWSTPCRMPTRVGDEGVGAGGAQVNRREAFQDLVRQAVGGGQRELERGFIGDARAVEIGRCDALLGGQRPDLRRGAVHEHDADAQRAQHGNVHQDIGEVLVGDDRAVHVNDERLLAELRDVLQDAPQVGQFHFRLRLGFRPKLYRSGPRAWRAPISALPGSAGSLWACRWKCGPTPATGSRPWAGRSHPASAFR